MGGRNTCRGLATLWLLHSTLLASTCRWMSRLQEGRGPLSSRLPRPTRQRRTSWTRLQVLKQQRRELPPHLTMRNGLYSLTRNPRLRPFRFRSRCWTRRWPQCTPPFQLRRAQPHQPQGTRPPLRTRPRTRAQQLPPLPLQQLQSTLILGSRWPAGDDEHGLLQRRRLARQPALGQGRGHRQGARHSPAGQEVDSGTSLGSLSAASLWSCLLETQSLYFGVQHWEGINPIMSQT